MASEMFAELLRQHRIMDISANSSLKSLAVDPGKAAHTFSAPSNVLVYNNISDSGMMMQTFNSGSDVTHELSVGVTFSASFMGVSVSGNSNYSNSSEYKDDKM